MTRTLLFLTLASVCAVGQIRAEQAVYLTPEQAAKVLARVARPELPREAIRTGRRGTGIFKLRFDYETGKLLEIHCVKSTGNGLLDVAAIRALKIWKAKPRSVKLITVPMVF